MFKNVEHNKNAFVYKILKNNYVKKCYKIKFGSLYKLLEGYF